MVAPMHSSGCPKGCDHDARVVPLDAVRSIVVRIEGTDAPEHPDADAVWRELCLKSPRLFAGPILSVRRFEPEQALLVCARDSYKNLVVQPRVQTGAVMLAVIGVLTARDAAGRQHVLLGRRGPQVQIYPGLWEFAPAGGVPPPPEGTREIGPREIVAQLREEMREEVGLDLPLVSPRIFASVRNMHAHSLDLVVAAQVGESLESIRARMTHRDWEYSDVRWFALEELAGLVAGEAHAIVPQTLALLRFLRWA